MISKLVVLLGLVLLTSPAFAQSAREDLKKDPIVVGIQLDEAALNKVIDGLKAQMERDRETAARNATIARMEKMLEDNPGLKNRLMNE